MNIHPIKTKLFIENQDLLSFITDHVKSIPEKSVIAVTLKIVSLSENRTAIINNKAEKKN